MWKDDGFFGVALAGAILTLVAFSLGTSSNNKNVEAIMEEMARHPNPGM